MYVSIYGCMYICMSVCMCVSAFEFDVFWLKPVARDISADSSLALSTPRTFDDAQVRIVASLVSWAQLAALAAWMLRDVGNSCFRRTLFCTDVRNAARVLA